MPPLSDISGLGPDAQTITNLQGGSQSRVDVRFDLIDPRAIFALAKTLHGGAEKYGPGNWRLIPSRDHLNHALMHVYAHLAGDQQDHHLEHAFCRMMMALAQHQAATKKGCPDSPPFSVANRPLPQDPEAERLVLGYILATGQLPGLCDSTRGLAPNLFQDQRHVEMAVAFNELRRAGKNLDEVFLTSYLSDHGLLDLVGGTGYIAELADCMISPAQANHCLRLLKDKHLLRNFIQLSLDALAAQATATSNQAGGQPVAEIK